MLSKPARKIGPNNRSITGKRPSDKTSRSQHFESALERDYLLLLEWDHHYDKNFIYRVHNILFINQGNRDVVPC